MHLVQATQTHLDTLVPLFDGYRQFYQQASNPLQARDYLQARLSHADSHIFLALGPLEEGLGFAQLYPSFCSIELCRLWILYDLYVAPNARQSGVGEALLHRAIRFAAETGAVQLVLQTGRNNLPAQRLYEKMGFQRDAEFFNYHYHL